MTFDPAAVQARMEKYKAEWYELPPHFYEQKIIADLTAALAHIAALEQHYDTKCVAENVLTRQLRELEQEVARLTKALNDVVERHT